MTSIAVMRVKVLVEARIAIAIDGVEWENGAWQRNPRLPNAEF